MSSVTVGGDHCRAVEHRQGLLPDDHITRGGVIEYYRSVAGRMLPYLRDRPVTMARYPDGITGPRIVQKKVPGYFPAWAYAQTVVAPYAMRARRGAHVATPLHWDEAADESLAPGRFTLRTIAERLSGTGDPWGGNVPAALRACRAAPPAGQAAGRRRVA